MLLARRDNNANWMTNWFDNFFDNSDWMPRTVAAAAAPAVNVKETDDKYVMELAAPGLKKEHCNVNIDDDGNLTVHIEHNEQHSSNDEKSHYLRREFSYSNYEQTYALPDNVERERISAKVENGILTVDLPKKAPEEEKKLQRQIEIL